jgi:hypothetical protein
MVLICLFIRNGERRHWPPAELYKYEVESLKDDQVTFQVNADQLYRKKHAYNKDKNRLYIKQFVHLDSGYWRLKVFRIFEYIREVSINFI